MHIIKRELQSFCFKCGDLQQAWGHHFNLDWVTISCFKNIEIVKGRYKNVVPRLTSSNNMLHSIVLMYWQLSESRLQHYKLRGPASGRLGAMAKISAQYFVNIITVYYDVGLPTQFRFNVGPALQLIAGPTLLQHWFSASYFYTSVYSSHWTVNQCCFNVDPKCLTMAQQQPNILYKYFAAQHCGNCYAGNAFIACLKKGHHPDNTIHWPNCEIMLGHRLRRWASSIPNKTLYALNHKYNREYFFSEHCLKTKVINSVTSNVIFDMFIRNGVHSFL